MPSRSAPAPARAGATRRPSPRGGSPRRWAAAARPRRPGCPRGCRTAPGRRARPPGPRRPSSDPPSGCWGQRGLGRPQCRPPSPCRPVPRQRTPRNGGKRASVLPHQGGRIPTPAGLTARVWTARNGCWAWKQRHGCLVSSVAGPSTLVGGEMAGSMAGRGSAGDSKPPVLRIARDEAERRAPVAIVVERPEARGRSEVDPMFSVAFRAFLLDLGILGTSISLVHRRDDQLRLPVRRGGDAPDRCGDDRVVGAADPPAWRLRGQVPGRRERGVQAGRERRRHHAGRDRDRLVRRQVGPAAAPGPAVAVDRDDAGPAGPVVAARLVGPAAPPGAVPAEHADRRRSACAAPRCPSRSRPTRSRGSR